QKYLLKHRLEGASLTPVMPTTDSIISHICSAPPSKQNDDRVRKMKGAWRVQKLKLNQKVASHNILLSYEAEKKLKTRMSRHKCSKRDAIERFIEDAD